MTTSFTAHPAGPGRYTLGEGPVWDAARERLLWVDIVGGAVHAGRLDPATATITATGSWSFDGTVGAVAVSEAGDLLVAEGATLTRLSADGTRSPLARVVPAGVRSRLNDGAVDPAGRFLIGSMAQDDRRGQDVLVGFEGGGVVPIDTDLTLSNGLAWSPAGDTFYSVDTIPGVVHVRDRDPATGALGERRDLFTVDDGFPDGLCVDADGNLWLAIWGRGRVQCHSPAGDLLAVVEVDAPHTSAVAFAGPGLDVLVITTATDDLSPAELAAHPLSGRLFIARVGATGLPSPYWNPAL